MTHERFTSLTTKDNQTIPCQSNSGDCNDFCLKTHFCKWFQKACNQLQIYENLKENGKLIPVTLSIGETLYGFQEPFGVLTYQVEHIFITKTNTVYVCVAYSNSTGDTTSECLDELEITKEDINQILFQNLSDVPIPQ